MEWEQFAFILGYQWRTTDDYGNPIPPRRFSPDVTPPTNENLFTRTLVNNVVTPIMSSVIRQLAFPGTWANSLAAVKKATQWFNLPWQALDDMVPPFELGLARWILDVGGQRWRLRTRTGNDIDSMLVDRRRKKQFRRRYILVVVCEGNYGFYEDGIGRVPLQAGYSVLSWNHPGYGSSSGTPSPAEEAAAIDVVVQFAILQCGWGESDIVIYGWSIGGYAASWAAMNYRGIRALILDATFDHILPLVRRYLPESLHSLAERAVRTNLNLDVAAQLARYDGPVVLIRRSKDTMMTDAPSPNMDVARSTNRINFLLRKLLINRYPNLLRDDDGTRDLFDVWVSATEADRDKIYDQWTVDEDEWITVVLMEEAYGTDLLNYVNGDQQPVSYFPMQIGHKFDAAWRQRMILYLAREYTMEYNTDHYTYLNHSDFLIPFHPWE